MSNELGEKPAAVARRKVIEASENYAAAKIDGLLCGFEDRTGQVKSHVEDGRGRLSILLTRHASEFTAEEREAMRSADAKLAALWDALHEAYALTRDTIRPALEARRVKSRALRVK